MRLHPLDRFAFNAAVGLLAIIVIHRIIPDFGMIAASFFN